MYDLNGKLVSDNSFAEGALLEHYGRKDWTWISKDGKYSADEYSKE